jgi:hypothetical protein
MLREQASTVSRFGNGLPEDTCLCAISSHVETRIGIADINAASTRDLLAQRPSAQEILSFSYNVCIMALWRMMIHPNGFGRIEPVRGGRSHERNARYEFTS